MARRELAEAPTFGSAGGVIGRPRKVPPDDAAVRIETLAAEAFNQRGIATGLGVGVEAFRRWLEESPELAEAYENGREVLHQKLKSVLLTKALSGEVVPLLFALKTMFGYREGAETQQGNKVQITFNLPGAMRPEQFTVEANDGPTDAIPVSRARAIRS